MAVLSFEKLYECSIPIKTIEVVPTIHRETTGYLMVLKG